jgi:hypothetical protein
MKKKLSNSSFLVIIFLFSSLLIYAEGGTIDASYVNSSIPLENYKEDTIPSDFSTSFPTNEDKNNFKKLREYLKTKEELFRQLSDMIYEYADIERSFKNLKEKLEEINTNLELFNKQPNCQISIDIYFPQHGIVYPYDEQFNKSKLESAKKRIEKALKDGESKLSEAKCLKANTAEIKRDMTSCQSQIDSALAPEYKTQEFRKQISYGFSALLGLLLVVFIVVVIKAEKGFAYIFFSDTGLQFITIFVLIIAIILFGILGALEGRELSAILAGISGYILGKSKPSNSNNADGNANASNKEESK